LEGVYIIGLEITKPAADAMRLEEAKNSLTGQAEIPTEDES